MTEAYRELLKRRLRSGPYTNRVQPETPARTFPKQRLRKRLQIDVVFSAVNADGPAQEFLGGHRRIGPVQRIALHYQQADVST